MIPRNIRSSVDPQLQKAEKVKRKSERILMEIRSVFPFTFFPDTIVIDENKITLIKQTFFFSHTVFPINFTDLRNAVLSTNLLFGSFEFELTGYEENPTIVNYLPKRESIKAHQLITGLLLLSQTNTDLSHLSIDETIDYAINIGRPQTATVPSLST